MTNLNQLTPEKLAEIRRHDEIDLKAAEKLDGALDETAWERHILLVEVDRLNKAVEVLGSALQLDSMRVVEELKRRAGEATETIRITAEEYHASRDNATGRVELAISGKGGKAVIDLGTDGDEILAGLLDIGQDNEDDFLDEEEDIDLAETCGDCLTGRCHGDGPCGCERHDVSVRAGRRAGR